MFLDKLFMSFIPIEIYISNIYLTDTILYVNLIFINKLLQLFKVYPRVCIKLVALIVSRYFNKI